MFKEFADQYYEEAKAIREDLHRHPELSYKEFRTAELIEKKLAEYGVDAMERMFHPAEKAQHTIKAPRSWKKGMDNMEKWLNTRISWLQRATK